MFRGAIFDLDGTLLDSIGDLANACNYALKQFSFPTHEVEKYKIFVGNGLYKLVERALPDDKKDSETIGQVLDVFSKYYNDHMMDMTNPYNGIIELLDKLIDKGIKIAVVSNKQHDFALEIIEKYFGDRFNIVFGHRDGYNTKPDPISVLEVIEYFNLDKEECIYIGDSNVDIITARNANVASVGVLWGFRSKEELASEGASFLAGTVEELEKIILC